MPVNKNERILVYTNLLFLIPIIIGLVNRHININLLLGVFVVFSTLYHLSRKPGAEWWWRTVGRSPVQTFLLISEIALAIVLAIWSIAILLQKSSWLFGIAFVLFVPSFVMFLSTNYKRYILYHSIWHIASAAIVTLVLI